MTTTKDDFGPFHPEKRFSVHPHMNHPVEEISGGASFRAVAAMHIGSAIGADPSRGFENWPEDWAAEAVKMADALIAELKK